MSVVQALRLSTLGLVECNEKSGASTHDDKRKVLQYVGVLTRTFFMPFFHTPQIHGEEDDKHLLGSGPQALPVSAEVRNTSSKRSKKSYRDS